MKDNSTKKELLAKYKERTVIGGVYVIRNTLNNRLLLDASPDLKSIKNRFDFAKATGSCVDMKLQKDWAEHGSEQFVFEVLEELEKGETQSQKEFKADIDVLKEIWAEKLSGETLY